MEKGELSILCTIKLNNSNGVFNQYLSNVKSPFGDNWRAEPTTFSMEKLSFSLKLLAGQFFCGQFSIKTLRSFDKALIGEFI